MVLSVFPRLPDCFVMANGLTSSYITSSLLIEVSLFRSVVCARSGFLWSYLREAGACCFSSFPLSKGIRERCTLANYRGVLWGCCVIFQAQWGGMGLAPSGGCTGRGSVCSWLSRSWVHEFFPKPRRLWSTFVCGWVGGLLNSPEVFSHTNIQK